MAKYKPCTPTFAPNSPPCTLDIPEAPTTPKIDPNDFLEGGDSRHVGKNMPRQRTS